MTHRMPNEKLNLETIQALKLEIKDRVADLRAFRRQRTALEKRRVVLHPECLSRDSIEIQTADLTRWIENAESDIAGAKIRLLSDSWAPPKRRREMEEEAPEDVGAAPSDDSPGS